MLYSLLGAGLEQFCPPADVPRPLSQRPLLVLAMDEGSVGYAMLWYAQYFLQARVVLFRDIYHREWNDCTQAIKQSNLWWVILMTSMVANLCYGPWEGGAWFEKVKDSARDFFSKSTSEDPLFLALYPLLCHDLGRAPEAGTTSHQE
eukprot:3696441-Lingulodinium_polyedra.AAC.1